MACTKGQNKGKRAEREVVKLLQPVVNKVYRAVGEEPPRLERNLLQANKGGYDIYGLDWLALEVKHQETFNLNNWWKQTLRQATDSRQPVLMYRRNNVKFRVRMHGWLASGYDGVGKWALVDINLEEFLVYFEITLAERIKR